jgi:aldehyde dehydrogenase (NAD+)
MPDADLDLAVEGPCSAASAPPASAAPQSATVWVHHDVGAAFVERYVAAVEEAVRRTRAEAGAVRPMIDERYSAFHEATCAWSRDTHQVRRLDGCRPDHRWEPRRGFVGTGRGGLCPSDCGGRGRPGDALYDTETFGPLVGVGSFGSCRRRSSLPTGTATACRPPSTTTVTESAFRFRAGVSAGMVSVNNSTSGAEAHLPFGGNARSGNGSRQSGIWVLDQFTRWQAVNWDFSGRLQKAQMDVVELPSDLGFRLRGRA